MPIFTVKKAGVFTSFQDEGRYGYQSKGVPLSGAMDRYASKIANHIVHNDGGEACLEVTFGGVELRAEKDHLIVICGASYRSMTSFMQKETLPTLVNEV